MLKFFEPFFNITKQFVFALHHQARVAVWSLPGQVEIGSRAHEQGEIATVKVQPDWSWEHVGKMMTQTQ